MLDSELVVRSDSANRVAVDHDFGLGVLPLQDANRNGLIGRYDDGTNCQCVRTNRYDDNDVESRVNKRSATTQRIGGGPGRCCNDQPVPGLSIQTLTVHAGNHVDHAARLVTLQHDVIDGRGGNGLAVRSLQTGSELNARLSSRVALQNLIDAVEHCVWRYVGEKAQPTAVDAEQRHLGFLQQCPA